MSDTPSIKNLPKGLLLIRITTVLFLLPWVVMKFTKPESTIGIFAKYYKIGNLPETAALGVAVIWALLLLAFALGFKKRISYGLVALFHGLSTFFTIPAMLPPYEGGQMLFLAAMPTFGALVLLYLMRDHDTIGTISK